MWTRTFWIAAGERAMKTAAQAMLVVLGGGVGLLGVDWGPALLGVLALTVSSVLTSMVSAGVGDSNSPSLVDEGGRHAA